MEVLILRKCTENRTSHGGDVTFPEKGLVEAPDWNGTAECGGGLHGLLWGHGSFALEGYGTIFQVIEADSENVIEFDGKCKFKRGEVLLTGSQQEAVTLLKSHPNYPKDNVLNYDIQIDVKFAVGGDKSTLKGGYRSTLKGGYRSTLTGGDWSTLKGGDESTLTGGDWSTLKGGNGSTLKGGNGSVFIVFDRDAIGRYVPFVKKITKTTANKSYEFESGKFNLIPKSLNK